MQIVSDLHINFGRIFIPKLCENLFIAGDVCPVNTRFNKFISEVCQRFNNVFYVAGNHEYLRHDKKSIAIVNNKISYLETIFPNFKFLTRGKTYLLGNHKVVGCTLWSYPKSLDRTYDWIKHEHIQDKIWLNSVVDKNTIVMTHYIPSFGLIKDKYKHYDMTKYASSCDDIIEKSKIWIYGHTHTEDVRTMYGCVCICNPRGLARENNFSFKVYTQL